MLGDDNPFLESPLCVVFGIFAQIWPDVMPVHSRTLQASVCVCVFCFCKRVYVNVSWTRWQQNRLQNMPIDCFSTQIPFSSHSGRHLGPELSFVDPWQRFTGAIYIYFFSYHGQSQKCQEQKTLRKFSFPPPPRRSLECLHLIGQFTEEKVFVSVRARRTRCVCMFASGPLSTACTTLKRPSPQATAKRETKGGRELMEEPHKDSDRGGGGGKGIQRDGWRSTATNTCAQSHSLKSPVSL